MSLQVGNRGPDAICAVCRENFTDEQERWTCNSENRDNHDPFHKPCLIECVNQIPVCPHDRTPINPNSLIPRSQRIFNFAKKVVVNSALSVGVSSLVSLMSAAAFNTEVRELIKTEASRLIPDVDIIADGLARRVLIELAPHALASIGVLGATFGAQFLMRKIGEQPARDQAIIHSSFLASIPLFIQPYLSTVPYTYAPLAAGIAACIGTCVARFKDLL